MIVNGMLMFVVTMIVFFTVTHLIKKNKNEVVEDCEKIKHIALQDAESIRLQATEEAMKIREGAELYAEQVLTSLEGNLTQLQQVVKNGQIYMEQLRSDSVGRYSNRK